MRLTMHTDFALRLLMLLAMEPDELHTIEEIARRYDISRNHLMKVTQTLAQAGFIDSLRGRGGGLRLARQTAKINLGDVIRATEDGFNLVECFDGKHNHCAITAAIQAETGIDEIMIDQLVRRFYAKIQSDEVLGPIFAARITDWEPHLQRMTAFWSSVALMSGRYHGQPMQVHLGLPVDADHF